MFLLSPSSYCVAMRLLHQIASGDGFFTNTDCLCGISAPKSQDIKKQKRDGAWGRCGRERRGGDGSFDLNRTEMRVC